jgi:hypothetical protein
MGMSFGLTLIAYSRHLHRRPASDTARVEPTRRGRVDALVTALFAALIILSIFWATALFADALGRGRASYHARLRPAFCG